jgi:preprotein translocase subunit SecG
LDAGAKAEAEPTRARRTAVNFILFIILSFVLTTVWMCNNNIKEEEKLLERRYPSHKGVSFLFPSTCELAASRATLIDNG